MCNTYTNMRQNRGGITPTITTVQMQCFTVIVDVWPCFWYVACCCGLNCRADTSATAEVQNLHKDVCDPCALLLYIHEPDYDVTCRHERCTAVYDLHCIASTTTPLLLLLSPLLLLLLFSCMCMLQKSTVYHCYNYLRYCFMDYIICYYLAPAESTSVNMTLIVCLPFELCSNAFTTVA
jgi:hypothetical protein